MAGSSTGQNVRRVVLALSAVAAATGVFWIGRSFVVDGKLRFGNPVDGSGVLEVPREGTPQLVPREVRAEVTTVKGSPGVRVGDKCEFLVERLAREDGSLYCNAQVTCGSKLLYGGPDRGYFPCRVFDDGRGDVLGSDPSTTSQDKDGAIRLDTQAGVLRVWDDASGPLGEFNVEAEVYGVR